MKSLLLRMAKAYEVQSAMMKMTPTTPATPLSAMAKRIRQDGMVRTPKACTVTKEAT